MRDIEAEKSVESKLRKGVRRLGGEAYKFVSPGQAGVPDRIVILPNRPPIFVELKTDKGKLSSVQKVQLKRLQELGQNTAVLYGADDVSWFLEDLRSDTR